MYVCVCVNVYMYNSFTHTHTCTCIILDIDVYERYPTTHPVISHIEDISVGLALIRILELGVAYEYGVHVAAGVLVELLVGRDHDDSYLNIAENTQLIGLLQ